MGSGHEAAGLRAPAGSRASPSPLVCRTRFWGGWLEGQGSQIYCYPADGWGLFLTRLRILRCPKGGTDPLMSWAKSQGDWLSHPRHLNACVGLLVGRAGAHGVPGLVPAYWWVEPSPGVSGYRDLEVSKLVSAY